MARFDADTNGAIIKLVATSTDELSPLQGSVPANRVYFLQFDEKTNAGLIQSYQNNPSQFTMPGGTLTQTPPSGPSAEVTVNPPGPYYDGFLRAGEILSHLSGDQAAIAAAAFRANGIPV